MRARPPNLEGAGALSIERDGDVPAASADRPSGVRSTPAGQLAGGRGVGPQPSQPLLLPSPRPPIAVWRGAALPVAAIVGGAAVLLVAGLVVLGGRAPRIADRAPPTGNAPGLDRPRGADPRRHTSGPYGAAIYDHERELDQCARDHGEPLPADARAVIRVGVDGRPRQVALQPATAEHSPLGGCIRRVLQAVVFPATPDEQHVALGLAVHR